MRHLRGGALGIRGHHDRLRGCADGAAAGRTLRGLLSWKAGTWERLGDMMSRILALCTGNGASQSMPLLMYMQDVQPGEYGEHRVQELSPSQAVPSPCIQWLPQQTCQRSSSAQSALPRHTPHVGSLRKICTRGGDFNILGLP